MTRRKPDKFTKQPAVPTAPKTIEDLVVPVNVKFPSYPASPEFEGVEDMTKPEISAVLEQFKLSQAVRELGVENNITEKIFAKSFKSFRDYCLAAKQLEPTLRIAFSDIKKQGHSPDLLFVHFLNHARKVFPHLEAIEELKSISDLTQPHNWYPEARAINRKIIFHAGPTNSGKTHAALQRFMEAETGIYCGPLRLLAAEIFDKTNKAGVACDLVTGEERRFAVDNMHPANHLSSTVEMLSPLMHVETAVIDEIQMLRDDQRGWAWTRALLGVAADEVHLCGEKAAVKVVRSLLDEIGEHVEVQEYERRTSLTISMHGLDSDLSRVEDGDAIVCFSRRRILGITRQLEKLGINCAVIYGDLPPATKLMQAAKFNDPNDSTNVMVATDAIGMGLNLNIRRYAAIMRVRIHRSFRVIFDSLVRPRDGALIPTYSALQIGGRAGRSGTAYEHGKVLTLRNEDMGTLRDLFSKPVEDIEKVGIAPTFEQIQTFSLHLPNASFVNLLDIFVSVCSISDTYFLCAVDQIRSLAVLIENVPLTLEVRYTFCMVPLNTETNPFGSMAFVKMARRYSTGQALTYDWFASILGWPFEPARAVADLKQLEDAYEVLSAYQWLGLRFQDMFPDRDMVRIMQEELSALIEDGVERLVARKTHSRRPPAPPPSAPTDTTVKADEDAEAPAEEVGLWEEPAKPHIVTAIGLTL
ncbi:ATP-dependent RNA helicase SUPV3L1 [Aphelenchoides avenae]|nr:ATP-dependent RNA helicase SUPV3L1 [Aphelenchus avenae]